MKHSARHRHAGGRGQADDASNDAHDTNDTDDTDGDLGHGLAGIGEHATRGDADTGAPTDDPTAGTHHPTGAHIHATHIGTRDNHGTHPDGTRSAGASWGMAVRATLHCLTGCAVGEILGMVIGTAARWGNAPTMVMAIVLSFLFGYSFTLFAVRRNGLDLKAAIKVALAADTVSIAVMELVDNGVITLVPGAMDAHLGDVLFWSTLLGGFVIAFLVTTPVNKEMIGRGKGHAVAHAHH